MSKKNENLQGVPGSKGKGGVSPKLLDKRGLTPKQVKFVKGVADGKPAVRSALEAYNTDNYGVAATIAVENMQKPNVRAAVDAELAKQGITLELALKPIKEALDDSDLEYRLKGSDRALKVMNAYQQDKDPTGNTINFNFGTKNYIKGN